MTLQDGRLSLAYRGIDKVSDKIRRQWAKYVEIIDLSNNYIGDVTFLKDFNNATSINLDSNYIDSNTVFPRNPKVILLWLNNNKIFSLVPFIQNLQASYPNLKYLCLMNNNATPEFSQETFYNYLHYRLYIISWFPYLKVLDDRPITEHEKQEAQNIYERPFIDRMTNSFCKCIDNVITEVKVFLKIDQNTAQRRVNQRAGII